MSIGYISVEEYAIKLEKLIKDQKLAQAFSRFLMYMYIKAGESGKAHFQKTEEEKKEYIAKIKSHPDYEVISKNKEVLKKLIDCYFDEIILIWLLEKYDINEIKRIEKTELFGLGSYQQNKHLCA